MSTTNVKNIDFNKIDTIVIKRMESIVKSVLKNHGLSDIELSKAIDTYFDYKQEKLKMLEYENIQLKRELRVCMNELLELKLMLDLGISNENRSLLKRVLDVNQLWKEYGYRNE